MLREVLLVIVGAEAGIPAELAELRARWHATGRLSVEPNVRPSVDQPRDPPLCDAVFSLGLINGERIQPRWSAAVHLALRQHTLPITAVTGILV